MIPAIFVRSLPEELYRLPFPASNEKENMKQDLVIRTTTSHALPSRPVMSFHNPIHRHDPLCLRGTHIPNTIIHTLRRSQSGIERSLLTNRTQFMGFLFVETKASAGDVGGAGEEGCVNGDAQEEELDEETGDCGVESETGFVA